MANGLLNIFGTQYGIPPGNWKDQLSIPYSDVIEVINVPISQTNEQFVIPTGIQGYIIIPTSLGGGTASIKFGYTTINQDYISPVYPTVITVDAANLAVDLYFTTSAYCIATVRFF